MIKMTPEQHGRLLGEIMSAKENMQDYHSLWRTILDEYCMRNYNTLMTAFSPIADMATADFMASNSRVPYINLYVRKMLGMVASRNNEYILDPRRPDQEVISSVLEFAFDGVVSTIDLENKLVETALWSLMLGTGIAKIGYASELVYGQEAWSSKKPVGNVQQHDADMPYRPTTERTATESAGNPIVKVIPTFDYFKDPGSRNDEELRREYVRYRRLLLDAQMDERYSRQGRENLVGFKLPDNEYLGDDWASDNTATAQDDALYCYVWEIIDIPSGMWCVVGENGDVPLIDWTPLSLPKGMNSPYMKCRLIPNLNSFFGISYAALMLPAAISMNVVKAQTISQISRDGKKVLLFDPNVVQDSDKFGADLKAARHMSQVAFPGLGDSPKNPWAILDYGGVNPELVRLQTMYQNDLATISQLTDQSRNVSGSEQTATEANIRNTQQQISVSDLKASFYNFHTSIARAICRIMLREWPQSKLIKVMGADPRVYFWYDLDREKVSDDFDIRIVMGMSDQTDRVLMRRQLAELTPQLMQIGDRINQDRAMQMQAAQPQQPPQPGQPPAPPQAPALPSTVNWEGLMELLLDQYDPKFKNKILRKKDPLQMVFDLVQTKGIQNVQMSPMLQQQVTAMLNMNSMNMAQAQMAAQGGVTPQNNGTINNNGGSQAKAGTPQYAGMPMADNPAFQTGRAASEAAGEG